MATETQKVHTLTQAQLDTLVAEAVARQVAGQYKIFRLTRPYYRGKAPNRVLVTPDGSQFRITGPGIAPVQKTKGGFVKLFSPVVVDMVREYLSTAADEWKPGDPEDQPLPRKGQTESESE